MKRFLMAASAMMMLSAPAFAGGYAAGIGVAGSIGSSSSTATYGSVDGGGNTTNGTVYATSQSSDHEGAQQSFGLNSSQTTSYSVEQGSGNVGGSNGPNGTYTGGVDYAAGGNAYAAGSYALGFAAYAGEYGNSW